MPSEVVYVKKIHGEDLEQFDYDKSGGKGGGGDNPPEEPKEPQEPGDDNGGESGEGEGENPFGDGDDNGGESGEGESGESGESGEGENPLGDGESGGGESGEGESGESGESGEGESGESGESGGGESGESGGGESGEGESGESGEPKESLTDEEIQKKIDDIMKQKKKEAEEMRGEHAEDRADEKNNPGEKSAEEQKKEKEGFEGLLRDIKDEIGETDVMAEVEKELIRQQQMEEEEKGEKRTKDPLEFDKEAMEKIEKNSDNKSWWQKKITYFLEDALGIATIRDTTARSNKVVARVDPRTGRKQVILGKDTEIKKPKKLVLAVDFSGSMGPPQFRKVIQEIQEIINNKEFENVRTILLFWGSSSIKTIMQKCKIYPYPRKNMFKSILGKGGIWGTQIIPAIEVISRRHKDADAIIWMTDMAVFDGDIPLRKAKSKYNRIAKRSLWVLTLSDRADIRNLQIIEPKWRDRTVLAKANAFRGG